MEHAQYKEILSEAIQREIDAQRFYQNAAARMKDGFLKDLFNEFVTEEKKHEDILRGFISSTPDKLPFDETRDYKVATTADIPIVSEDMKPADAFALAMKKEEEAMNQYSALAEGCTDAQQQKIFRDLAAMEREHKLKMENAFVDIGYPEVW